MLKPIDINTEKYLYGYDLEVFKDFFSATFLNLNKPEEIKVFVVYGNRDDRKRLKDFIYRCKPVLVSFNGIHYDNIVLNATMVSSGKMSTELFLERISLFSQAVIEEGTKNDKVKEFKYMKTPYQTIDLLKIRAFDRLGVSLKQAAVNLKWHRLQDLPIHWESKVKPEEVDLILDYNLNDVKITAKLFEVSKKDILLRQDISKLYGVDVMNRSDSTMASALLDSIYEKETGEDKRVFTEKRTARSVIEVKDCLSSKIKFKTPFMQQFLEEVKAMVLFEENNFKFKKVLNFAGNTFDIGVGGLHSRDKPDIFKSTDNLEVIDADVTSFYPSMILVDKIKPEHIGDKFFSIMEKIKEERVVAKKLAKKGDANASVKNDALKLLLNSIFGRYGSQYYWLFDPKAMIGVTISGQMYLLMLIEMLHTEEIEVISANTDGVVSKVKNSQKEIYNRICKEWEESTGFELEFANYLAFYRRDVNNYITVKPGNEVKEKGVFETKIQLNKGFKHPVISRALRNYFVDNINPIETLKNHKDIYDFLISEKSSSKFETFFCQIENGREIKQKLQKNNRFYAALKGGVIYKQEKGTDKQIRLLAGQTVMILNDVDESKSIEHYGIDYNWYLEEVNKIINKIEPTVYQMDFLSLLEAA